MATITKDPGKPIGCNCRTCQDRRERTMQALELILTDQTEGFCADIAATLVANCISLGRTQKEADEIAHAIGQRVSALVPAFQEIRRAEGDAAEGTKH